MNLLDLFIKIGVDSKEAVNEVGSMAQTVGAKTLAMGNLIANGVEKAFSAAVGFVKDSVQTSMDFDSAMSQVQATMGENANKMVEYNGKTMSSIDALREYAQEMGATTAFSAKESAEALNYMALAGYDAETSMSMLPNVLNLAAAGNIDLAYASDMVTDAQSALGLSIEETTVMVDEMAKVSSTTNTSVEQLGEAILTIGATARNVKGGTAELTQVLGLMADNGIKGSEGGTHLRNMILSLQNPTKDATALLNKYNIKVYDSAGQMRSMQDIMLDLQKSTKGMTDAQRDAMVSGIFNKTDLAAVNALLNTTEERWNDVASAIEQSGGAAELMAQTQLDNLNGDVTLFKSALEGAQIALTNGLTPNLRTFVQLGAEGLSSLTEGIKEGGLTGALEAVGNFVNSIVGKVIDELPNVLDSGVRIIETITQGIVDNIPTAIGQLTYLVEEIVNFVTENADNFLDIGLQIIEKILEGLTTYLPTFIEELPDKITTVIDGLINAISEHLPTIIETGTTLLLSLIQGLVEAIPQLVEKVPEILQKIVDTIIENLPLILESGIQIIQALIEGTVEMLPEIMTASFEVMLTILGAILEMLPDILEAGIEIIGELIAGIISMAGSLLEGVKEVMKKGVDYIKELPDKFKQWGRDMIQGLIDGIKEMAGSVGDAISGIAGKIAGIIHFSRPDEGPLRNYEEWMPDMIEGLTRTLHKAKPMLLDEVAELSAEMADGMQFNASIGDNGIGRGYNQTVIINAPDELSPSEVARQTKIATQEMLLEMV